MKLDAPRSPVCFDVDLEPIVIPTRDFDDTIIGYTVEMQLTSSEIRMILDELHAASRELTHRRYHSGSRTS